MIDFEWYRMVVEDYIRTNFSDVEMDYAKVHDIVVAELDAEFVSGNITEQQLEECAVQLTEMMGYTQ